MGNGGCSGCVCSLTGGVGEWDCERRVFVDTYCRSVCWYDRLLALKNCALLRGRKSRWSRTVLVPAYDKMQVRVLQA
jgi:hypothetical protein